MAFFALALLLASIREHCLALVMATTLCLLGGGEAGLGVGCEPSCHLRLGEAFHKTACPRFFGLSPSPSLCSLLDHSEHI